eukprot:COSAG01_NODE_20006_length_976_cov_1.812999_1_plen_170_part_00
MSQPGPACDRAAAPQLAAISRAPRPDVGANERRASVGRLQHTLQPALAGTCAVQPDLALGARYRRITGARRSTEHADPRLKVGDEVRLKVMKGAIDSSTLKPNWTRGVYKISKARQPDGSKAPTFRVEAEDGNVLKDTYTATDLLKISKSKLQRSPIKVVTQQRVNRPI